MPSNIDVNFPPNNVLVSKGQMRAQWATIKREIEALRAHREVSANG